MRHGAPCFQCLRSILSPTMRAMAENREVAGAMARLDALTDWEQRPRSSCASGSSRCWTSRSAWASAKGLSRRACRGHQGQGLGFGADRSGAGPRGLKVGRYGSPHVETVTERVTLQGREVDEATLARALTRALDVYEAARRAAKPPRRRAGSISSPPPPSSSSARPASNGRSSKSASAAGSTRPMSFSARSPSSPTSGSSTPKFWARPARDRARESGHTQAGGVLVTTLPPDDEAGRVIQARADKLGSPVIRVNPDDGATIEETNVAIAGLVLD